MKPLAGRGASYLPRSWLHFVETSVSLTTAGSRMQASEPPGMGPGLPKLTSDRDNVQAGASAARLQRQFTGFARLS